jgi:hypothetical protein
MDVRVNGLLFPEGVTNPSGLQSIQTGPGAHAVIYSMDNRNYSPASKAARPETRHLSASSTDVKNK